MALTLITHVFISSHTNKITKQKRLLSRAMYMWTQCRPTHTVKHTFCFLSFTYWHANTTAVSLHTLTKCSQHIFCAIDLWTYWIACTLTPVCVCVCVSHLCTHLYYSWCSVFCHLYCNTARTCPLQLYLHLYCLWVFVCVSVCECFVCEWVTQLWWALKLSCSIYSLWQVCCYSGNSSVSTVSKWLHECLEYMSC